MYFNYCAWLSWPVILPFFWCMEHWKLMSAVKNMSQTQDMPKFFENCQNCPILEKKMDFGNKTSIFQWLNMFLDGSLMLIYIFVNISLNNGPIWKIQKLSYSWERALSRTTPWNTQPVGAYGHTALKGLICKINEYDMKSFILVKRTLFMQMNNLKIYYC